VTLSSWDLRPFDATSTFLVAVLGAVSDEAPDAEPTSGSAT
jgi:hypothetical protein